jgi:phage tail-like protein
MRSSVDGLLSPRPLEQVLPPVLADDDFAVRFVSGFDGVLAPIFSTLDNLGAYLDPGLAPEDFVTWLGGWVGVASDDREPAERRRRLVAAAAELVRRRGTVGGLADEIALHVGLPVEVVDSGGCTWSATPGQAPPGSGPATVTVRVGVGDPATFDRGHLEAVVAAALPAHVSHEIEVVKE